MSGISGDWAALASQHERLMRSADESRLADTSAARSPSRQWDELTSQRERLAEKAELPGGLASSSPASSEFRLAVRAA